MKKNTATILIFFLTTLLPAQNITLLVPDYPPFSPSPEKKGLWCELVSAAFLREGREVKWETYPIERANMMVRDGLALGVVNSEIAFAGEVGTRVFFGSEAFFWADVVAFFKRDFYPLGLKINRIEDLSTFQIGGLRGTGSIRVLTDARIPVQISDSIPSLVLKLNLGRIDGMILGDLTGLMALKDYLPLEQKRFSFESVYQSPINLIFSKKFPNSQGLAELYQKGLSKILNDGTYLAIVGSYYPEGKINPKVLPPSLR